MQICLDEVALFWMSQWTACSPAWWILYHVTASCKGPIVIIYRRPFSSNHNCSTDLFLLEFGTLLEQYATDSVSLLIAGDFNLQVDNSSDKASQDFLALIDSFNLKQHVCSPTHRAGHTLDLLITRVDDHLVTSISTHDATLSDHFVFNCNLSIAKPLFVKKQIYFRRLKTITVFH